MSRKFIDDHVELRTNSLDGLPAQNNQYYDPGHLYLDPVSGKRFVNEGANDRNSSLFVSDQYNAFIRFESFDLLPAIAADAAFTKNTNLKLSGTNAASSCATFVAGGGGVKLTTTTSSADQVILSGISSSAWGLTFAPDNQIVFETQIVTDATITARTIWAGLKLTTTGVTATDNDQTFFRYDDQTNGGNFQIIDSNAGTDNVVDSGVTVAASTAYLLQIKVGTDLLPRYYINGVHVGTGLALATGTSLIPVVGIQTTAAAAKAVTVRHLRLVVPINPIV